MMYTIDTDCMINLAHVASMMKDSKFNKIYFHLVNGQSAQTTFDTSGERNTEFTRVAGLIGLAGV